MRRHPGFLVALLASTACGSKGPPATTPTVAEKPVVKEPAKPAETEDDREQKRRDLSSAIVPEGSSCLPPGVKDASVRLELAAVGTDAIVCANDTERTRLLGPIGCWKLDLATGNLAAVPQQLLPGGSVDVKLDDHCARAFCLPADAKLPGEKVAHMAINGDNTKMAVLVGDDVHIFDKATKTHQSSFSIRGDKGLANDATGLHWVGTMLFVEGGDGGASSGVWAFKEDGTQVGAIETLGAAKEAKAINTAGGGVSVLDTNRIALAEQGWKTLTEYEVATGKRTKLVRTIKSGACKKDEEEAFWKENDAGMSPKCKEYMGKTYGHLVGATAVAGSKNFLVMLRGPRLGELAVMDSKTLAEKKSIKMPWCGDAAAKTEK